MQRTRTPPAAPAPHGDLAELLSAVLLHPDLPNELNVNIGDWITGFGEPQAHEPARIRRALDAYAEESYEDDDQQPTAQAQTAAESDVDDLALHLSAVLTNPTTPDALYNAIKVALCPFGEADAITNTVSYLRLVFAHAQAAQPSAP
jgi:hypothetical protein